MLHNGCAHCSALAPWAGCSTRLPLASSTGGYGSGCGPSLGTTWAPVGASCSGGVAGAEGQQWGRAKAEVVWALPGRSLPNVPGGSGL